MEVFSTIASPAFSELVVVFADYVAHFTQNAAFFDALRMMNEVIPFALALLLEFPDSPRGGDEDVW